MSKTTIDKPVFVTRWALSQGIRRYEYGEVTEDGYFTCKPAHCMSPDHCFVGPKDWTYDQQLAEERRKLAIRAKLRSVEKQKKKLLDELDKPPKFVLYPKPAE